LATLDDSSNLVGQDEEGLLTLKEMLLHSRINSNGGGSSSTTSNGTKKPPRPSSIPAAKKFGGVS